MYRVSQKKLGQFGSGRAPTPENAFQVFRTKKAQKKLNFKPKYNFLSLIKDMIDEDLFLAQEELNKKY